MTPEPCVLTDISRAVDAFAFPSAKTQTSQHIKRLHWYVACRLVIEGGFHPEDVEPRPPFSVVPTSKGPVLHHEPSVGGWGERNIYGGLKTKAMDVSVCIDGVGPVVAVSLKGTHNAFRNLTNRMEEAAGDCTNLHLAYPALVYGFWHVIRANEEDDPTPRAHFPLGKDGRYDPADVTITTSGRPSASVQRLAHALERLSDREDLRDSPSRYEACGMTLISVRGPQKAGIHSAFPGPGAPLDFNRMFGRIYDLYDQRFVYQAPILENKTRRNVWRSDSPIFADTLIDSPDFAEMVFRLSV